MDAMERFCGEAYIKANTQHSRVHTYDTQAYLKSILLPGLMVHLHVCLIQSYITSWWLWFLVVCHDYRRHFGIIFLLDVTWNADCRLPEPRPAWFPRPGAPKRNCWRGISSESASSASFKCLSRLYLRFNLQQDRLPFASIQKGDACVSEHPEREGKSLKTAGAVEVLTAGVKANLCHSQPGSYWIFFPPFSASGIWTESCETRRMPNSLWRGLVTVTLSFLIFH